MIKRGTKKEFNELISFIKENSHSYNKIRLKLNDFSTNDGDLNQKNNMGRSLLHIAIKLKDKKLLQMLINAGVFIDLADSMGHTPLHYAVMMNRLDLVKVLVEKGADLNMGGEMEATPLHLAVSIGALPIIKYLIEKGADYNQVDENNLSPIDYALDEQNKEILNYFLDKNFITTEKIEDKKIKGGILID
ncbi:MAG: ankyrin repeat domain-containing protein [Acholeplasmataceae bacterium]|nr:ankyrin repeat domain-containing protein [Acholeplasmataceae bacterium]